LRDTATKPVTEPVTDEQAPVRDEVGPVRAPRSRGRHRKPRPRRALYAVGGLALAAGALSLLRPGAELPGGGVAASGIAPTAAGSTKTPDPLSADEATVADGTPTARTSPSATAARRGGNGTTPASGSTAAGPGGPTPSDGTTARPTSAPATTPKAQKQLTTTPSAPSGTLPHTPRPPRPTPALDPEHSDLCVPIVGLCVGTHGQARSSGG
jgi:hypothetical protein